MDYFAIETLIRIRPRVRTLVLPRSLGICYGDVSLKRIAAKLGFGDVREVDTGDVIPVPGGEIVVGPFWGEHGDIAHGSKATYLLRVAGKSVFIFADAQPLEPRVYQRLASEFGRVGTVFMNTEIAGAPLTWQFQSLFPSKRDRKGERSRRCRGSNKLETLALLDALGASAWVNYAMGLEPWCEWVLGPISTEATDPRMKESDSIIRELTARGIHAKRLFGRDDLTL